jgi:hypothetical protein
MWLTLLSSGVIFLPLLNFGLGFDHGILQIFAWAGLHGRWPITDIFESTWPGGILLHMLVIGLGGTSTLSFRLFDFTVQMVAVLLIFRLSERLAGPRAGALAAIFYAVTYVTGGFFHTGQRDGFIVPFMLLGLLSLQNYSASLRTRWIAIAGLNFGLVCLIRPSYGLLVGIMAAYLFVVSQYRGNKVGGTVHDMGLFVGLAGLPLICFVAIYAYRGALSDLFDLASYVSALRYFERYTQIAILKTIIGYSSFQIAWLGVVFSLFSVAAITRSVNYWLLAIACVAAVAIRILESHAWLYHLWPLFACAAILAGVGWDHCIMLLTRSALLPAPYKPLAAGLITTVILAWPAGASFVNGQSGLPHTLRLDWYLNLRTVLEAPDSDGMTHYRSVLADDGPEQALVARYLREHTTQSDLIEIWGAEPGIYYAAKRFASSRLLTTGPLTCLDKDNPIWNGADRPRFVDECEIQKRLPVQIALKNELLQNVAVNKPPKYIVAHYINGSLAISEGCMACFAPDFPELRWLIDQKYIREVTFGFWSIFKRKENLVGSEDYPNSRN